MAHGDGLVGQAQRIFEPWVFGGKERRVAEFFEEDGSEGGADSNEAEEVEDVGGEPRFVQRRQNYEVKVKDVHEKNPD